jgi:hypothetical protein
MTNYARALFLSNTAEERAELLWIALTYLLGINESGNQKGNLSYLAGTKKRSDSLIESRRGSAGGRTTMTLLRERGRSDDNDARAFLLSNTAEERAESLDPHHRIALRIVLIAGRQKMIQPIAARPSERFTHFSGVGRLLL